MNGLLFPLAANWDVVSPAAAVAVVSRSDASITIILGLSYTRETQSIPMNPALSHSLRIF